MSKLNIDDDDADDNNENIDYQILCDFDISIFNGRYLGYIFVIILYFLLLFIYVNINIVFYWFFLLSLFILVPTVFIIIYVGIKKDKRDNIIIKLVKKEHIEIPGEDGFYHYYYFYTDTNIKFSSCESLYNFLQGNETIQVTIKGYSIYGLVKII